MIPNRTELFRKRVLEAESRAFTAKAAESRRAWLIVAREWTKMLEREEKRIKTKSSALDELIALTQASE